MSEYATIIGLEVHVQPVRQVVRDQGWNADTQVHQHARLELSRNAAGDDFLCVHGFTRWR